MTVSVCAPRPVSDRVPLWLPAACNYADQYGAPCVHGYLSSLLQSDDFKMIGNTEKPHADELRYFRELGTIFGANKPFPDKIIFRMAAFAAGDAIETMTYGVEGVKGSGDKGGHAMEAFSQIVDGAVVHAIRQPSLTTWWCLSYIPQVGETSPIGLYPTAAAAEGIRQQMRYPGQFEVYSLDVAPDPQTFWQNSK